MPPAQRAGLNVALPTGWAIAFDARQRPFYVNYNQSPPHTTYAYPGGPAAGLFGMHAAASAAAAAAADDNPTVLISQVGNTRIVLVGRGATGAEHVATRLEEIAHKEDIEVVRQLAKVASCFACIDLLCMVPIAWVNLWISLSFCVGPLCGIQGCHHYHSGLVITHMVILVVRVFGWLYLFTTPKSAPAPLALYFAFVIVCNVWSFRIAQRLYSVLQLLSEDEVEELKWIERRSSPRRVAGL
jgi:hypothetical protein